MRTTILLLLLTTCLSAQPKRYNEKQDTLNQELWTKYSNALTVFTNDRNWGLGLMYDHRWQRLGFYVRYSQGDYPPQNEYAVEMEYKIAGGILFGSREDDTDWWPYLSLGLNYNWYKYEEISYAPWYDKGSNEFTQPWSFDFGVTTQLWRFSQFVTWDPIIKKQLLFGIGGMWNFNKR
jgi:hypothetical protein